jgi:tetraacyldisaccharide 4'-kinase
LPQSFDQYAHDVLSGRAKGFRATTLRALTSLASPLYATAVRLKNALNDAGIISVKHLPRPVVSVGNITTGGTGKTPVVLWLYQRLRSAGHRPAILMRGYMAKPGQPSDERQMLRQLISEDDDPPIIAQPDRYAGGQELLRGHHQVTAFILDDGFQHRRLARDFDLVLIDATNPFGYGRVLPRGLLREPLSGLKRAHAILLTRTDLVTNLDPVVSTIRRHNPEVPIYQSAATHTALRARANETLPLTHLAGQKFSAFAGIGNPHALEQQLRHLPGQLTTPHWFPDHHAYTRADLQDVLAAAQRNGAQLLLTTEKDWVKIAPLLRPIDTPPIHRLNLSLTFEADHEQRLFDHILSRIKSPHP